jgi:hypothetical protein
MCERKTSNHSEVNKWNGSEFTSFESIACSSKYAQYTKVFVGFLRVTWGIANRGSAGCDGATLVQGCQDPAPTTHKTIKYK